MSFIGTLLFGKPETEQEKAARVARESAMAAQKEQERLDKEARERVLAAKQARDQLVKSVEELSFDAAGAEFNFSARVKSEADWNDETLATELREYRRFHILAALSTEPLVPSASIDKIWRVHLLYNRHYISALCGRTLKKMVHRKPAVDADFDMQAAYDRTLALYKETFGETPNWDGPAQSFSKVLALPQTSAERDALRDSSGNSDGWLLWYIVTVNGSYNDTTHTHGSGSTSFVDSSSSSSGGSGCSGGGGDGGGGGGGGGGCGGGGCGGGT
jgi:uncharacterized membrane protein YgcG